MSCPECGLDYESMPVGDAVAAIRGFPRRYRAPLTRLLTGEDVSVLRARPEPETWSALEYAAHVRDVYGWYDERVQRSLVEDRPVIEGDNHEVVAVARRYNEQDPATVADELAANAERLADTLEAMPEDAWDRVHVRWGEERTVLLTARRAVHEGNHHLLDIGRVMRTVREGTT